MKAPSAKLHAALEESLARHKVAGASLAILQGGAITTAAAGVTNVTTGVEITPETVMHIGSIAKIFNASLVMQLVDEGVIELDERVLRYLPDLQLKDREALAQITVRMLLNHTSGIDGDWLPLRDHDEETLDGAIARFADLGQLFRPGTECAYCNAAAVIAGYLVQRLRGRGWYHLVRERIFEPLGMGHAVAAPEDALLHRASVGHYLAPDQRIVRTSLAFLSLGFAPAGSTLMMSARDLITFARVHIGDGRGENGVRILSGPSVRAMQTMSVDNSGKGYLLTDGVGLGWMVSGDGLLSHRGGGPGVLALLYVHPAKGFAAAVLTNSANGYGVIHDFVDPWLKALGLRNPYEPSAMPPPHAGGVHIDRRKYVGRYEDVLNGFTVSAIDQGLALSQQPKWAIYDASTLIATPPEDLISLGQDRFCLAPSGAGISPAALRTFEFRNPGATGEMTYLATGQRLYRRAAREAARGDKRGAATVSGRQRGNVGG